MVDNLHSNIFFRMVAISLSLMVNQESLLELLHIFRVTILGHNILADSNKVHSPTGNVESVWGMLQK
jgi:hypothetical protein